MFTFESLEAFPCILDAISSTVHLKMINYNYFSELVVILTDLCEAHLIHEMIFKESNVITLAIGKKVKETPIIIIAAIGIDLHEGEAMSGDELDSLVGTIVKTLRPVLEGNFEMI